MLWIRFRRLQDRVVPAAEDRIPMPDRRVEPLRFFAGPGGPGREIIAVLEFSGGELFLHRFEERPDALRVFVVPRLLDEFFGPFEFPVEGTEFLPLSVSGAVLRQLEGRQEEQFQCIAEAVFDTVFPPVPDGIEVPDGQGEFPGELK